MIFFFLMFCCKISAATEIEDLAKIQIYTEYVQNQRSFEKKAVSHEIKYLIEQSENYEVIHQGLISLLKIGSVKLDNYYIASKTNINCSTFKECHSRIIYLSQLASFKLPLALRLAQDLRPQIKGLTFKVTLGDYQASLKENIYLFKLDTLINHFEILTSSKFNQIKAGELPLLLPSYPNEEKFLALSYRYQSLSTALKRQEPSPLLDYGVIEDTKALAFELHQGQLLNEVSFLYGSYLTSADFSSFEKTFTDFVDSMKISSFSLYLYAAKFLKMEAFSINRHKWVNLLTKNLSRLPGDQQEQAQVIIKSYHLVQEEIEQIVQSFLGISGLDQYPESNPSHFYKKEQEIAKTFPLFRSLPYQVLKLVKKSNLFSSSLVGTKDKFSQTSIDHHDDLIQGTLTLYCYAEHFKKNGKKVDIEISFSLAGSYKSTPCDSSYYPRREKGVSLSLEQRVIQSVYQKRINLITGPVKREVALQTALIPLTVLSGGLAGVVAKGGTRLASFGLSKISLRYAQGKIAEFFLIRTTSAVAGALSFTIMQKVGLHLLTMGHIPFYDSNKTLWKNYGKELLFGSAIFFVLPFTSTLAINHSRKLIENYSIQSLHRQALIKLATQAGTDTMLFTSLPYIERSIHNMLTQTNDPIFISWKDAKENFLHSAMIALAFRVGHTSKLP